MKPGARLILLEELISETPDLVPGQWIDLLMLAITGGRERMEKEYSELFSSASFELEEVVPDGRSAEHPHSEGAGNDSGIAYFLRLSRASSNNFEELAIIVRHVAVQLGRAGSPQANLS
jgi:hypothetical protein